MGETDLNEMSLNLRVKLDLNESIITSTVYKDVELDFSEYS